MLKTPRPQSKRPPPSPYHCLGKRPGAELASLLSVGDGDVSEAGKRVLSIGNFMPEMWVGHVLSNNSNTDKVRRGHSPCPCPAAAPRFLTRPPSLQRRRV